MPENNLTIVVFNLVMLEQQFNPTYKYIQKWLISGVCPMGCLNT